jgi:uncharacterized damage-inducible protein DinB
MIATQNALAETLTTQYRMNGFIVRINLEGITQAESLVRAVPNGNHINWIVGHVVSTRCALLPALHQEPPVDREKLGPYTRGSHVVGDAEYLSLEQLLQWFDETQERVLAGVAALTDEELAAPAPFSPGGGPETLASLLMKSTVHEGYHLGQTGILRRVIGKPGAIK